jgi:hypothetical protein
VMIKRDKKKGFRKIIFTAVRNIWAASGRAMTILLIGLSGIGFFSACCSFFFTCGVMFKFSIRKGGDNILQLFFF